MHNNIETFIVNERANRMYRPSVSQSSLSVRASQHTLFWKKMEIETVRPSPGGTGASMMCFDVRLIGTKDGTTDRFEVRAWSNRVAVHFPLLCVTFDCV
jgi:hypothetical protein